MGFNITLLPDNQTFFAEAGEAIFDAAMKHGIQLLRGCGDGACGLCKGNVLQGTVDHGRSTILALPEKDREAGIALFCCAMPTSDLVIERRPLSMDMMDWDAPMD